MARALDSVYAGDRAPVLRGMVSRACEAQPARGMEVIPCLPTSRRWRLDVKHVFRIRRSRRLLSVVALLVPILVPITVELAGADDRASMLPAVTEHRYRMLAKVRPLLVWISRDNVGDARITWRNDGAGSMSFELLIGSDPARAPRRINRWGYLAEHVAGGQATVLGVMKQSNEQSIEEAEGRLTAESGSGTHLFKAIRSTTADGRTSAGITTLRVQNDLTYRDVESLLAMVSGSGNSPTRTVTLPAGTRPGFLVAVADLIHQSIENRTAPTTGAGSRGIRYVYNGHFHTLRLRSLESLATSRIGGRTFSDVVRGRFETANETTGNRTRFEITYGASGALAEVPIHIAYQPRWWFQVELFLTGI